MASFLACFNLYQFSPRFLAWSAGESQSDTAPELPLEGTIVITAEWKQISGFVVASLKNVVTALATAGLPLPETEYYLQNSVDDQFAELAWPDHKHPVAVLVGEQEQFASLWQAADWQVVTGSELKSGGIQALLACYPVPREEYVMAHLMVHRNIFKISGSSR